MIKFKYDKAESFASASGTPLQAVVKLRGKDLMIDLKGNVIVNKKEEAKTEESPKDGAPVEYNQAVYSRDEGDMPAQTPVAEKPQEDPSGKTSEKQFSPADYDEVRPFYDDVTAARRRNKWGYINAQYKVVVDFVLDEAGEAHYDYKMGQKQAWVRVGKLWGLISLPR